MKTLSLESPCGRLTLAGEDDALTSVSWKKGKKGETSVLLRKAERQLAEYFSQKRQTFDLPLAPQGTPFQKKVWRALQAIPYGKTVTYGALARKLKTSPRAVGGACGKNPLPILIPCHRVLGQGGKMGGYSGGKGIPTKQALLKLEGAL